MATGKRKVKAKKHKIIERKLGRRAVGYAHFDTGLIEIDPRQNSYSYMETLIHEKMHLLFPHLSERQITIKSKAIAQLMWDLDFRRTYQK